MGRYGYLAERTGDEVRDFPQVVGVEFGLHLPDPASRRAEVAIGVLGRTAVVGTGLALPRFGGLGGVGLPGMRTRRAPPLQGKGAFQSQCLRSPSVSGPLSGSMSDVVTNVL